MRHHRWSITPTGNEEAQSWFGRVFVVLRATVLSERGPAGYNQERGKRISSYPDINFRKHRLAVSVACFGLVFYLFDSATVAAAADNPTASLQAWAIEQRPGGTVSLNDGALVIEDAAGCTVWFREKLTAPVEISYDVTVVSLGGPQDRISDLNCFWMAVDPRSPAAPFTPGQTRSGKFSDYDTLQTYYVGYGGNNNTTTRFRRYDGTAERPLLPEHDLRDKRFLLLGNRIYHIRLVARDGVAEFWRDGERIFAFRDSSPLNSGWFAIRTVHSHLVVRNLIIKHP